MLRLLTVFGPTIFTGNRCSVLADVGHFHTGAGKSLRIATEVEGRRTAHLGPSGKRLVTRVRR